MIESQYKPANALLNQICNAGDSWMSLVKKGQIFRILDLEGNQAVDTLFYNADNPEERYSAVDTIVRQRQIYLTTDSILYSSEGNAMLTIVVDTCGRHDTLGGACSAESNTTRYALEKRPMHSCRDSFMHALNTCQCASHMSKRDITGNINFFMNVPVTADGALVFADGISGAGKYVEMRAEMDVTVLISNCPQLNNPCNGCNPTPVQLLIWNAI
jgi:urea carboxylase-associated protein 1